MLEYIKGLVEELAPATFHTQLTVVLLLLSIALVAVAAYHLTKFVLMMCERVILRSPTDWDDDMLNPKLMRAVSQLAPALVVSWMMPHFFAGDSATPVRWIDIVTSLYILWAIVRIVVILIENLYKALMRREATRAYAITGIFQMFKLVVIGIGVIVAVSILINKTPTAILTALGASAAVMSLVFKDTLMGLVASIQLSANKMLQRGDWITVPNSDLNGEVIDVTLTTVKVRNWDNSVTTIPPYSLVNNSFRNYRPMQTSGGRRVDQSIYIDVNTVRFLGDDERASLAAEGLIAAEPADAPLVNLRAFRDYVEGYLRGRADVNADMTLMVRQLEPTPSGLPIQLYFFTRVTAWVPFEHIQAEVFDHVYAVVHRFGLAIFQTPAGADVARRAARD